MKGDTNIMEESKRKKLKPGDSILLSKRNNSLLRETYTIDSVIGEGSSVVCYTAIRESKDGVKEEGILKEFYPLFSKDGKDGKRKLCNSLLRLPNHQLVPVVPKGEEKNIQEFNEMCEEYYESYKQLMEKTISNKILNNYFSRIDILCGFMTREIEDEFDLKLPCVEEKKKAPDDLDRIKPTIYIWSQQLSGEVLDSYLEKVREDLKENPEKILRDILIVMKELTDCIKALHEAGMLHMDIKPSNFLVCFNTYHNISNIMMIDINTICDVNNLQISGTPGYSAPEIRQTEVNNRPDNRADIYSIGATLFEAIVITDEIPNGKYQDSYYGKIEYYVKNSKLFKAIKTDSDESLKGFLEDLMGKLCEILKKCLAEEPADRYPDCTSLMEKLVDAEKKSSEILDEIQKRLFNPTVVIQKLLYEHPLYETINADADADADADANADANANANAENINVLVMGLDDYGQKFIDICLQVGQTLGVKLNIDAVSNDKPKEARKNYLRFKPALSELINKEDAYATLNFKTVDNIFSPPEDQKYNYVFVSMGKDKDSKTCAEKIFSDKIGDKGQVFYVCRNMEDNPKTENDHGTEDGQKKLYPICVKVSKDDASIKQMQEMAFNTYVAQKDSPDIDFAGEHRRFFDDNSEENKYNRAAALAFALSLKYKLHSVQIESSDLANAAAEFSKLLENCSAEEPKIKEEAEKKFNRLVDHEHRRWLIEHAVNGWTAPRNDEGELKFDNCITQRGVKNIEEKTHLCMVQIDELEQMSIKLHGYFMEKAKKYKDQNTFKQDLSNIYNDIPSRCEETVVAFKHFKYALENIYNGVKSYIRQYSYYRDIFEKSLYALSSEDDKNSIRKKLNDIEDKFFPIIESKLNRNYKANYEVLIKKIPFILTYQYKPSIAIAFEDGKYQNARNEAVFANVAAATVLSPENIKFFYCFNKASNVEALLRKLDGVLNYFNKKNMHPKIEMVIACLNEVSEVKQVLDEEMTKFRESHKKGDGNAWFEKYEICEVDSYEAAAEKFVEKYLTLNDLYDGSNPLFPSAYDNGKFIDKISSKKIPYFEFDWRHKEFSKRINCEYLQYVKDASFIRVEEMFALMKASDNRFDALKLKAVIDKLWKIYSGNYIGEDKKAGTKEAEKKKFEYGVRNWNRLCNCLQNYENNQQLAVIEISTDDSQSDDSEEKFTFEIDDKKLTFEIDEAFVPMVRELTEEMKEKEYILKDCSEVKPVSMGAAEVEWDCVKKEYAERLKTAFFNKGKIDEEKIGDACVIKFEENGVKKVKIKRKCIVDEAKLDKDSLGGYELELLNELKKERFIIIDGDEDFKNPIVSFKYYSEEIKKLLTNAGAILEVYAYYKVLETDYFDDVVRGYEFQWESDDVKNELDLVLTKGFKSIFVECKAVRKLDQGYYHKLNSISNMFGIGTIKVMLANTYDKKREEENLMQKGRGNQMYIETISGQDDIKDVGEKLKNLMEES